MKGQTEVPVLFSCEKLEKVKEELFYERFFQSVVILAYPLQ